MADNFKIVNGAIGALVNPGNSFTIPYPAGTSADTFYADGHVFILNGQRVYTDPAQAGIAFGGSNITITNNTSSPWLNGDTYEIQLNSVPVDTFPGDVIVARNLTVVGTITGTVSGAVSVDDVNDLIDASDAEVLPPIIGYDPARVVSGWTPVIDDTFVRANTTPPASIGVPTLYYPPSINGAWTDASAIWKIQSNQLVPSTTNPVGGPTGPTRPVAENILNQRVSIVTGPVPVSALTAISYVIRVRAGTSTASYDSSYFARLLFNPNAQTAQLFISSARSTSSVQAISATAFSAPTGHTFRLFATAETLYSGGFTILRAYVVDMANPNVILSRLDSVLVPMYAAVCCQPSTVGIIQERSDIYHTELDVITRFLSERRLTNVLTGISSQLVTNTSGNWVSVSGAGNFTVGTPGAPFFRVTNLAGCSITEQVVISPSLARLKITTGATAGTLRIVDPSSGGTYDLAVVASSSEPLLVTNLVPVEDTTKTVKIHGGLVTGGKAPYTFQWYRSTAWDASPGTAISGATSIDLVYTPADDQLYSYKLVATDSSTIPLTGTSPACPALRGWRSVPAVPYRPRNYIAPVKLGYGGDSITISSGTVPPFEAALVAAGVTITSSTNMAVSGSYTGTTGNGWNPASASGVLTTAINAWTAAGVTHILFMLGTNDAQSFSVAAATYISNWNAILTQINTSLPGVPVILNTPPLATGGVSSDANVLGITYVDALDQVVAANANAVRGDRYAMEYFYGRYNQYADEIHPNTTGVTNLGTYWADAFLRYLDAPSQATATGTAYSLTATSALVDFGTKDPVVTLGPKGNYLITYRFSLKYNAATFAAVQNANFKLRRTNRAAADLANSTSSIPLGIVTVTTAGAGSETVVVNYRADVDYDVISLFGAVSVIPSAGSLDVVEASITAQAV